MGDELADELVTIEDTETSLAIALMVCEVLFQYPQWQKTFVLEC